MNSFVRVYTIENPQEWDETLKRMYAYDFYHSYSYNMYYSIQDNFPLLFVFKKDNIEVSMPLIVRNIIGHTCKDVTSAYGYLGPLASHKNIDREIISHFWNELDNYFKENNIISAFSRLHPSLENDYLIEGLGNILSLSETVYIDLNLSLEDQRLQFKKGVKSDLSKLYQGGFEIFEDSEKRYIEEFIEIYNDNMLRVGALKEYFFDDQYYNIILKSPDINSKLFFVIKDGIMIAGSIFVFTGDIIQYHLSATKGEYLKNSPIRFLIDYVRKYGKENNYKEFHLGGGVGSSADSLFIFKTGFSRFRHQFKVWRYIVDIAKYNELSILNGPFENQDYFPLYRSP